MLSTFSRNTLIASTLLVSASLLVGPAAFAQVSDNGEVSGEVQEVNTITFAPATLTEITSGAAVASYPMGNLTIQNNAAAGWDLEVQSLNGGKLVNGAQSITYTDLTVAAIAGATITPVDLATAATDELLATAPYSTEVAGEITRAVTATMAADQFVPVGVYTDTLTFTLTSKL
ncbi:MAG: hypothetical protein ACHWZW_11475 [Spirulina sp.]